MRLRDGKTDDRFKPSVYREYIRRSPWRQGYNGMGPGIKDGSANKGSSNDQSFIFDFLRNPNYAVQTAWETLYQFYSFTHDINISGQYGVVYSNGSATTLSLLPWPPSLRESFAHENGLSSNFTLSESDFTVGQGQLLQYDAISSLTGVNINPITGTYTNRTTISSGPLTITSSIRVQASIKPLETGTAAVLTAGLVTVAASQFIPGPFDEGFIVGGGYKLCQATGLCK